ncbi:hypothetical protein GJ496_000970 [Pomphorhynchus laevis]|nr:hypothetical protein GJ496_000970 [Pomphorhynchus laevis]
MKSNYSFIKLGLSVALVEKNDYSSGTSSKSTKLLHGGVRYLQKAITEFDREQFHMVKEALSERANLIQNCPYLAYPIPIMLPIYSIWQVPYFWIGIKMYDLVAGRERLKPSRIIGKKEALKLFPMLKQDNLYAAIVYYDGQHNDSRMNVTLAMTASAYGADVVNHVEVKEFLYNTENKKTVCGAKCWDKISDSEFHVRAKSVVNATGPLVDILRLKDDDSCRKICQPSAGIHIVLPNYYCPSNIGLLDPSTQDGRVVFLLPWENHTIAGTTDAPCDLTDRPTPTDDEVEYILSEIRDYLSSSLEVRRGDVLSVWAGVRPLVIDPSKQNKTEALARNHIIEVSKHNLITVAGGKWTTCRQMAEDVVDKVLNVSGLPEKSRCMTRKLKLIGSQNWSNTWYIQLAQDYGLDSNSAKHLSNTYGNRAEDVMKLCKPSGKRWPLVGRQLHARLPYLDGEIRYAINQHACSLIDVIANRTRMAFLNVSATRESLQEVADIMAKELNWSKQKRQEEIDAANEYLSKDMGWSLRYCFSGWKQIPSETHKLYEQTFDRLDKRGNGYISFSDFNEYLKKNKSIDDDELLAMISELDGCQQNKIGKEDFCKILANIESGRIGYEQYRKGSEIMLSSYLVERSGGGV